MGKIKKMEIEIVRDELDECEVIKLIQVTEGESLNRSPKLVFVIDTTKEPDELMAMDFYRGDGKVMNGLTKVGALRAFFRTTEG